MSLLLPDTKSYDFAGNLLTFKNRGGAIQTFTYDGRDREKTYGWNTGDPQPRTLSYDDAARITSCNTTNSFINFTYFNDNSLKPQANGSAYKVDMLYNGQKCYSQLDLYDLRDRVYLPGLGRFLQPDPIGFAGVPAISIATAAVIR